MTCCFQGNFLGTRQIAFLPEVTRDNTFRVSKALRHPCLKFHLKFLCYSYYYYCTQCLTSLSYHQAANIYLHLWAQSHAPRVNLRGSGCRWPGQAGDAGQGTVQCLAVHETGTMRGFLPSSFSLSPEWAMGPDRTFFCAGSVPGPWYGVMISATSVRLRAGRVPGFHRQLHMKMFPFCS